MTQLIPFPTVPRARGMDADRDGAPPQMASSVRPDVLRERVATASRADLLEIMREHGDLLQFAPAHLRRDEEVALAAVASDGFALADLPMSLQDDERIVTAAVARASVARVRARRLGRVPSRRRAPKRARPATRAAPPPRRSHLSQTRAALSFYSRRRL